MLYKDYKQTDTYICADAVDIIDSETGEEINLDLNAPELDDMIVVNTSALCGELTIALKSQE